MNEFLAMASFDIKKIILAGILTKTSLFGKGGAADFGGGDIVRAEFLNRGAAVVLYLEETEQGRTLIQDYKLDVEKLKASLDVNKIVVTEETLVDRTGSVVDAVGAPGVIALNHQRWLSHSERDSDVYFLVFHEMLRENGINDDNYVVSKSLTPFPEKYRLRNILVTEKPLILADRLDQLINRSAIVFGGSGCPSTSLRTFTRFNPTLNEFEIYPNEMTIGLGQKSELKDLRKGCAVRIPLKSLPNKKIQITQIDVSGEVDLKAKKTAIMNYSTGFTASPVRDNQTKTMAAGAQVLDGGFLVRDNKLYETVCGKQAMLTLDTSLLVNGEAKAQEKISVARVNRMKLSMKLVDCK